MTSEELYRVLNSSGIPFVLGMWEEGEAPSLPFGVYAPEEYDSIFADGENYLISTVWRVELYTEQPDSKICEQLETALKNSEIKFFKVHTTYIKSERMWVTEYII